MSLASIALITVLALANAENTIIKDLSLLRRRDICVNNIPGQCGKDYNNGCSSAKKWLFKMIDASSKIPSGLLEGNVADFGFYDECLKIHDKAAGVNGKYCLGFVKLFPKQEKTKDNNDTRDLTSDYLKKIQLTFAACVPDSCSGDVIGKNVYGGLVSFPENLCQSKDTLPKLTTGDCLAISFFAIIAAIIIASSAYDYYLKKKEMEPKHPLLLSFSFISNGKSLFKLSNNPNQISCLHGIRSITIIWIMLSHLFFNHVMTSSRNSRDMYQWFLSDEGMFVVGATVSVDTFFMLSGMVMVYAFLIAKPDGGLFNVPMYYLHRYLRLTPSLAVLLLIHVTIIKHMGSGPIWPMAMPQLYDNCAEYWWSTLLYIQNWVNIEHVCLGATWYLSVDMQLFILSPIILIPLKKYTNITLGVVSLLTFASMASCFYVAFTYNLNGLVNLTKPEYGKYYYMATYARAAPWLIGTIVGYILHEIKCAHMKFRPNKIIVWGLWIVALTIMCLCVFAGNNLVYEDYNNKILNSVYLTFVRPSWAIAVAWVVLACVTDNGGPINSILSFWPFQFVAKISYNLYLLHLPIQQLFTYTSRNPATFSPLWEIYFFWGHFVVISVIATIWTLAFESPIIILEKYLLGSKKTSIKEEDLKELTASEIARKS